MAALIGVKFDYGWDTSMTEADKQRLLRDKPKFRKVPADDADPGAPHELRSSWDLGPQIMTIPEIEEMISYNINLIILKVAET